jgi:hypothetical protein
MAFIIFGFNFLGIGQSCCAWNDEAFDPSVVPSDAPGIGPFDKILTDSSVDLGCELVSKRHRHERKASGAQVMRGKCWVGERVPRMECCGRVEKFGVSSMQGLQCQICCDSSLLLSFSLGIGGLWIKKSSVSQQFLKLVDWSVTVGWLLFWGL